MSMIVGSWNDADSEPNYLGLSSLNINVLLSFVAQHPCDHQVSPLRMYPDLKAGDVIR